MFRKIISWILATLIFFLTFIIILSLYGFLSRGDFSPKAQAGFWVLLGVDGMLGMMLLLVKSLDIFHWMNNPRPAFEGEPLVTPVKLPPSKELPLTYPLIIIVGVILMMFPLSGITHRPAVNLIIFLLGLGVFTFSINLMYRWIKTTRKYIKEVKNQTPLNPNPGQ
jgi:hypothetical protein